jgi:TPR repeat protein
MRMHLSPLFTAFLLLAGLPLPASAAGPDSGALCDQLAGNPLDPDLPGMKGVKGAIWELIGADAEATCRRAIAEHPGVRRYVFQLGRALDSKDNYTDALVQYQRAADMGSAIAINSIGLAYEHGYGVAEDPVAAVEYYQKAANAGLALSLGNIALLYSGGAVPGKTTADAIPFFEREIAAGEGWGLYDLADVYLRGDGVPVDRARAEQLLRRAMADTDPQVAASSANSLAWSMVIARGDLAEAERLVNLALSRERSEDLWSKAHYYDTRALIYHRTGRDALAVTDAEQAVKYSEDMAAYHDRLGDIYAALGRRADAIAAWQKALMLEEPAAADEPDFSTEGIRKKIAGARSI